MILSTLMVRDPNIFDGRSGQQELSDTTLYLWPGHLTEEEAISRWVDEENADRLRDAAPDEVVDLIDVAWFKDQMYWQFGTATVDETAGVGNIHPEG